MMVISSLKITKMKGLRQQWYCIWCDMGHLISLTFFMQPLSGLWNSILFTAILVIPNVHTHNTTRRYLQSGDSVAPALNMAIFGVENSNCSNNSFPEKPASRYLHINYLRTYRQYTHIYIYVCINIYIYIYTHRHKTSLTLLVNLTIWIWSSIIYNKYHI